MLAKGDALVVQPYTIGVQYSIVAVYLGAQGTVIAAPLLAPGRLGPYFKRI